MFVNNRIFPASIFFLLCSLMLQISTAQRWDYANEISISQGQTTYTMPFVGGMSNPQFQGMDLNWDGLQDRVIFDNATGTVYTFIYNFDHCSWQWDASFQSMFPPLEQFLIIHDYDRDGIVDLFTSGLNTVGIPGIQVYKGSWQNNAFQFDLVVLDQDYYNLLAYKKNEELINIDISSIDIPFLFDVNNDGDLDVLNLLSSSGSIAYYENQQVEEQLAYDQIYFELVDDCWGKFFEDILSSTIMLSSDPTVCASEFHDPDLEPRHAGSTLCLWDGNYDGAMDVLIGDFQNDHIAYLENGGTTIAAWMNLIDYTYPSATQSVDITSFLSAWVLYEHCEGKEQILFSTNTQAESLQLGEVWSYLSDENNPGNLQLENTQYLVDEMIDLGRLTAPIFIDYNADGLMDILCGTDVVEKDWAAKGLAIFENVGSSSAPVFNLINKNAFQITDAFADINGVSPTAADLDGDGDLDLLVGAADGRLYYGENTAQVGAEMEIMWRTNVDFGIDVGSYSRPDLFDLDEDGDLDLIVGERFVNNVNGQACGNINYFENIGSSTNAVFDSDNTEHFSKCLGQISTKERYGVEAYSAPRIKFWNGQKVLLTGSSDGSLRRYNMLDDLAAAFPLVDSNMGIWDMGSITAFDLIDLNEDGILDAVVGNESGGLQIFKTSIRTDGTNVGVVELSPFKDIQLVPNPAHRSAGYELTSWDFDEALSVDWIDLQGQVLYSDWPLGAIPQDLISGLYFLRIKGTSGVFVRRLTIY